MTGKTQEIIVLGAGYAGMLATVRLAGKTRGLDRRITLMNAADIFVERIRLHEMAAGQTLRLQPLTEILRGTGVTFVQGVVDRIDADQRRVVVQTETGTRTVAYDRLLYALGSITDRDTVPGVSDYAYTLALTGPRSVPALGEALRRVSAQGGRLIVCGGGATGIESAAEFADSFPGLHVELITRDRLGLFLNQPVADYMRRSLEARRVVIRDQTGISALTADAVLTADGDSIPYDLCLWTGGFTAPPLARQSGLAVNERGQILIDPFMRSISHPAIYAAGDAAQPVEVPGFPMRMSALTALITGAHAADCLAAALRDRPVQPLSFAYPGQGIALGHHNAIGFNKYPDDVPNAPYFTGRAGYEFREFGLRFLADLPNIERRMPGFFNWPGRGRYAAIKRRAAASAPSRQTSA